MTENIIQKQKREIRDKEIVGLYPQLTLEEIGKRYGIKRARVSQIIKKAAQLKL